MTRRKIEPLRELTEEEQTWLERISRSQSEPASHVARAKQILSVARRLHPSSPARRGMAWCHVETTLPVPSSRGLPHP